MANAAVCPGARCAYWCQRPFFPSPVTWAAVISFPVTSRLRLNPPDGQRPRHDLFRTPRVRSFTASRMSAFLPRAPSRVGNRRLYSQQFSSLCPRQAVTSQGTSGVPTMCFSAFTRRSSQVPTWPFRTNWLSGYGRNSVTNLLNTPAKALTGLGRFPSSINFES